MAKFLGSNEFWTIFQQIRTDMNHVTRAADAADAAVLILQRFMANLSAAQAAGELDGKDGHSATIIVKTNTAGEYILTISNANETYDTPNLRETEYVTDTNTGRRIKVWYGTVAEFNTLPANKDDETEYNILEEA